jgi:hypothetical protein
MRRQLARIPHAEFIVFPEASHSINSEQPEAFNQNVLSLSVDIKTQAPEVKSAEPLRAKPPNLTGNKSLEICGKCLAGPPAL